FCLSALGQQLVTRKQDMGCAASSKQEVTKVYLTTPVVRFRDSTDDDDLILLESGAPVFRKTTGRDLILKDESLPAGRHSLKELAICSNVVLVPPHVAFTVEWESGRPHGQMELPGSFNGIVPIALATPEFLAYYGATLTSQFSTEMITLKAQHELIEFEYSPNYKEKWVLNPDFGPGALGLEKHEFPHLECPLDENSGILLLAKYEHKELHLTGFRIPAYHTIYLAPQVIHSNDHLRNRWKTMLTSFTDEEREKGLDDIDHVLLKQKHADGSLVPAELQLRKQHFLWIWSSTFKVCNASMPQTLHLLELAWKWKMVPWKPIFLYSPNSLLLGFYLRKKRAGHTHWPRP
ncbi:unnamed protein product, partial [Durusdinium trenchii]